ncbi:MAG: FkbM family methyltransferase [Chloroflexota bacterium]
MEAHKNALFGEDILESDSMIAVDLDQYAYFKDHAFQGMIVLPGSAYVSLAVEAVKRLSTTLKNIEIVDVSFTNILILSETSPVTFKISCESNSDGWDVCFESESGENRYATMRVKAGETARSISDATIQTVQKAHHATQSAKLFYARLRDAKNEYGRSFQGVYHLWQKGDTALGQIQLPLEAQTLSHLTISPILLDVCSQVLAGTHDSNGRTFMLTQFNSIQFNQPLQDVIWSYAQKTNETDDQITGNVFMLNSREEVVAELQGVTLQYLAKSEPSKSKENDFPIAVAASFTSEPIEESLDFWGNQLNRPVHVQFAPYNQLFQQLLDPDSLLATNEGANLILMRPEDWVREANHLQLQVDAAQKEALLTEHSRRLLPNQIEIAHLNQYETDYVFKEIFVDRCYLKHGIELKDGDTVIDIGANIGLFSLFVQQQIKDSTIYCFDPSPPIFELLKVNAQLYGQNMKPFNYGISDSTKEATFTFYEKSSVFSSFHADAEEDETAVREVVINMLEDSGITDSEALEQYVAELMADRMNSTPYSCQLRSLSDIIRENGIAKIDLLKVDAEKSELAILQGIDDEHWSMINQIVLEVHDQEGSLIRAVQEMLEEKGFHLAIEEETLLKNSGLFNIFGKRPNACSKAVQPTSTVGKLEALVDEFTAVFENAAARITTPTFVMVCPPSPQAGADPQMASLMARLEQKIASSTAQFGHVHFISSHEAISQYPAETVYDPVGDQLGHVPYTPQFFASMGTLLSRKLAASQRAPYKVIVLDCDNTLWQGVVGEDGPAGIDFSGPWAQFQQLMIDQISQGMVLCLNSKNNEPDVMAVFDERPDMPLKKDHLVSWRINWQPKSQNLIALAEELNLSLDSFIFLDDNPVEIAEVNANAPQVLALQLPQTAEALPTFAQHLWALDQLSQTQEDRQRTQMYQENAVRERARQATTSMADFLASLDLKIKIETPSSAQLPRVAQLTQRTNQFNISTIRRTQADIEQLTQADDVDVVVMSVEDRFGAYGLVGDLFFKQEGQKLIVDTFLLSCRVLGRGVEHQMLAHLGQLALERSLAFVELPFVTSAKNEPAAAFLDSVGSAYKVETDDGAIYTIPAAVAFEIQYSTQTDVALETVNERRKTAVSAQPHSHETLSQIAHSLNSSAAIMAQMAIQNQKARVQTEAYVAPTSSVEKQLVQIWQSVLGVEKVGVNDNFREIGGTSLNGVQLIAQIKRELSVDLSIIDLFEHPTVRAMTRFIEHPKEQAASAKDNGRSRGAKRRESRKSRRRR